MCGRYTLTTTSAEQLALRFDLDPTAVPPLEPRYNIAPTQRVPVIVDTGQGRDLLSLRWGFQPAWAAEKSGRPAPINARAESLLDRPMFRGALARKRCLIVADGFYEWASVPGQAAKQPMYIRLKDGGLFALAGLYTDGAGDAGSCAIITTSPNRLMEPIHNRMPAILDPADEARWLDSDITVSEVVLDCLRPYPAEAMTAYPVSMRVNAPRNDGAELVAPLAGRA